MKIKRYVKIFTNIFLVFGIDGFRILMWLALRKIYGGNIKSVYCRNLRRRVYVRAGSTDVILMVLMFCVDCDKNGRREYDIDLGNRDIEFIIDAGANVGLFSLLYAKKYPDAKIICIEPDHDNFKILNMNVSNNKNIYAVNKGLWSKETYLQVIDRHTGNWGFMVKESGGGPKQKCLA